MSILIKGMKMPTTCCNCKFREPFIDFAYCHLAEMDMEYEESDNCRHPDCPLVEIPTPHGRLGDLDKLMTEFMDSDLDHLQRDDWKEVIQIVEDAPTVIEAEGET